MAEVIWGLATSHVPSIGAAMDRGKAEDPNWKALFDGYAPARAWLAEHPPERELAGIVLISAPFVGPGGWGGDGFELPPDLGARLPPGVPVHVFHGLADETAPPQHADLFARAIPQAQLHRLPGRDHQLDDDLGPVADVIAAL